jgi:hypothetical protein
MTTKAGVKSSEVEVKEKEEFSLPYETVKIQFIKKQRGAISDVKHVAFGGMLEGTAKHFVPKKSKETFKYIPVLDAEEQKFLEEMLGYDKGGLGLYKDQNNFWDKFEFSVPKEGMNLRLFDPIDYIRYKILLTYTNTVSPSLADLKLNDKATYYFVMVRQGEEDNVEVVKYNVKKEAYKIAEKLELNPQHIREFLYLKGTRVAADTPITWLISRLGQMVENEPEEVVNIYTTKDYKIRSLVARGVLSGVIKDVHGSFSLEDGITLCEENESPSLASAIKFLSNPANASLRQRIEAKIG